MRNEVLRTSAFTKIRIGGYLAFSDTNVFGQRGDLPFQIRTCRRRRGTERTGGECRARQPALAAPLHEGVRFAVRIGAVEIHRLRRKRLQAADIVGRNQRVSFAVGRLAEVAKQALGFQPVAKTPVRPRTARRASAPAKNCATQNGMHPAPGNALNTSVKI